MQSIAKCLFHIGNDASNASKPEADEGFSCCSKKVNEEGAVGKIEGEASAASFGRHVTGQRKVSGDSAKVSAVIS